MRMLINASHGDELRVAITSNSVLVDLYVEYPGQEQKKSNIYKGRISSIEPSLGAVFVDYGSERHGFLPLKEISPEYFLTPISGDILDASVDLRKILREGQEIVVQIDKEERGTKGAALTTFISLAGSYLVLMPNNPDAGGISRRIEGDDRDSLHEIIKQLSIPEGMGVIIRTAGVSRSKEELEWDLRVLLRYWEAIKQAAVAKPGPYLIHQESDVIIRAVRDHLRQDIIEVIIDDQSAYQRARDYIAQVRPDFVDHIKLYTDKLPLFSRFQIERQIEAAYQHELRLPSGGAIVIDHTEALVAIDINSSRATKGGNIEETALQTNLEAADEIARQLRIRDIGGLVVIDFIDMTPIQNQREVENRLRNALHLDRARIQIGRISRFGLLEMSRQRLRAALNVSSEISCPHCDGRGSIRSIESVAISIVHLIQENASRVPDAQIQVQLPIDITTYLMNEKRGVLAEIEAQTSAKIIIIPNQHLKSPHYHLKTTKDEHSRSTPSYQLVRMPRDETITQKQFVPPPAVEPAVSQYLTDELQAPVPQKPQQSGLIKRLWDVMFGAESAPKKPVKKEIRPRKVMPIRTESPTRTNSPRTDRPPRRGNRQHRGNRRDDRRGDNRGGDGRMNTRPPRDPNPRHLEQRADHQNLPNHNHHVEKPMETREEFHQEAPTVVTTPPPIAETPSTPTPVVATTPVTPPAAPSPNYKGLSSSKPLQQVTTKKD